MPFASIGPIASYLPEKVEDNDFLKSEFPNWDMDQIYSKTGIRARHIAAPDECASDLGVKAAERLFEKYDIDRDSIDFLLFCTQSPDYPLPTTSCVMQERLGLPTRCGAIDFNLGCSGYVYGLMLADGLIQSGASKRILFITSETYTKYIDPTDRSLRTIFGDGAAATLIDAAPEQTIGSFRFGTDGTAANTLMVMGQGHRLPEDAPKPSKRKRWPSALYMDGPEIIRLTLKVLPDMVEEILQDAQWQREKVDYYLMHQATLMMLENLREHMKFSEEQMPLLMEEIGNTVSSTIPLLMEEMRADGRLTPGKKSMMVGFGVGFSWAGCTWVENWQQG